MGSVVSSAANGVGTLVGNVVSAPFKLLFGASCESVCSGTWGLPCFIEHVCISGLLRLFVVIIVTYNALLFGYVLCKLGIVKCVAKNAFKMVWKPCSASSGKRCARDVERGEPSSTSRDGTGSSSSSSEDDDDGDRRWGAAAGSRSRGRSLSSSSSLLVKERRKDRIRQSLRLKRISSKVERVGRVSQGSGRQHRHSSSSGIGPRRSRPCHHGASMGMSQRLKAIRMRTADATVWEQSQASSNAKPYNFYERKGSISPIAQW